MKNVKIYKKLLLKRKLIATNIILFCLICFGCSPPIKNKISDENLNSLQTESEQSYVFKKFNLNVNLMWISGPYPSVSKASQLLVIISDNEGNQRSLPGGLELDFYSSMPSMGHPIEDIGYFEEIDIGIFINKNIRFQMNGVWKNELWIIENKNFEKKDEIRWQEQL